ncbi:DUF4870 domain-containing protein [Mucilaginibacter oryzae]|uniref:DUF4870 domain-containing protein n=1 Tax=Mucilaginibacter oryzae TaxID=468058 RepID=UPI000D6D7DEC|nr:DUF4870 domain-containing protein [Mucilaginibacter oryzae]
MTEIPEDLIEQMPDDNRNFLTTITLSALSFIIFPLLGIVIPLGLWLSNRRTLKGIDKPCKRLINFQISWCLSFIIFVVMLCNHEMFHFPAAVLNLGMPEWILLSIPLFMA